MGLDMYLDGEAFYAYDHPNRKAQPFEIAETIYQLGYWRKRPNLHGFIVETFADGVDECQKIELSTDDLGTIIKAVDEETLPHTDGFFRCQRHRSREIRGGVRLHDGGSKS